MSPAQDAASRVWSAWRALTGAPPSPRPALGTRRLKAADHDWHRPETPIYGPTGAQNGARLAAAKARAAYFNNSHLRAAGDAFVGSVAPRAPRPRLDEPTASLWTRWARDCDLMGNHALDAILATCALELFITGEFLVVFRAGEETPSGVPLRLEVKPSAQLDHALHQDFRDGRYIRHGVEFTRAGRPVAYYFLRHVPGHHEPTAAPHGHDRVEARFVAHGFERHSPGQIRGVPKTAPVLHALSVINAYTQAAVVNARAGASKFGFLKWDPEFAPDAASLSDYEEDYDRISFEGTPGHYHELPPGMEPVEVNWQYPNDEFAPFIKAQLRAVAAGLGLTYEQLSGDLEGVTYSSARVALLEVRRRFEAFQRNVIVDQFMRPAWRWFTQTAAIAGVLPAEAGEPEWILPAFEHVDPQRAVAADVAELQAGLTSRAALIAKRGRDIDRVDAERAADPLAQQEPSE